MSLFNRILVAVLTGVLGVVSGLTAQQKRAM